MGKVLIHFTYKEHGFLLFEVSDSPQRIKKVKALHSQTEKGFSPLMMAVRHNSIYSAMCLLQANADPDSIHSESGNTALHFAAEQGNEVLVKMLVSFFADTRRVNGSGRTPLDLARESRAEGAKKCAEVLQEVNVLEQKANQVSGDFQPSSLPQDTTFLLSFDGGGSRGIISCQLIIALHKRMKELQSDCAPLQCYFDYVAGTSAGAILGLGLTHAKVPPELCRLLSLKGSEHIFKGTPTFPTEAVEKYLKEAYGQNLGLADAEKPRVIITSVLADKNPPELHLFRNYGDFEEGDRKVWECARASSAAPLYFDPFEEKFIDGGVMANNPTLDAMTEIFAQGEREDKQVKLGLVLSIGTGVTPATDVRSTEIHVPKLSSFFHSIASLPSDIMHARNLLQVFISQSTQSNGQETQRAQMWCNSVNASYYRWSPPLGKIYDLSESDKAKLTELMYETHLYTLENYAQIDEVARLLLSRGIRS